MKEKICIAYLSTYPPRECGIATFSADLINYSDELFSGKVETKVVAINTGGDRKHTYNSKVIFEINDSEADDYIQAAELLNSTPEIKIVSIQHEFGIFGGDYGKNLIFFLANIKKPVSVTFHTVLSNPAGEMKLVMDQILARADKVVVMTELSKEILIGVYSADPDKIKVIPHGIHPQLYVDTKNAKQKLGLENKLVLATFGFLSRGKGIEYAIRALPRIIEKYPETMYLVLGQTHPVVLKKEGEVYREKLIGEAKKLGLENHVVFHNKYLSNQDLFLFLEATDIYLALSQDPNQTVSGTLSYALGTGRAVISTKFKQAKEIVSPEVGILIDFNDSADMAEEVLKLFDDKRQLQNMSRAAYFRTRSMTWPNVALAYMSMYSAMLPLISEKNKQMLPIKIDYLERLTDDFGVLQFASLNNPDPKWGYTLDDNARALVVLCWHKNIEPAASTEPLIRTYLDFIEHASNGKGDFFNYFNQERKPDAEQHKNKNMEDANARAMWALAVASESPIGTFLKTRAENLFKKHFILHEKVSSPRAAAFYIKALAERIAGDQRDQILERIKLYADFLVDLFERSSDEHWRWFEESLTYSNAVLPEALLIAYTVLEDPTYFKVAKDSLDFLITQSFEGEVCVPVGQAGWYRKGSNKERYDQQPEEVSALVLALHKMVSIESNPAYSEKLILAFDWFLGNNLSKQIVYTHTTGGSYDGISKGGVNLNQGSESTLSYLLARLAIETVNK